MLIAHLPSGYLVGALARRLQPGAPGVLTAALVGSILPDLDVLWFYAVDGGRTHHHAFISHWPLFWAAVCAVIATIARVVSPRWLPAVGAFAAALLIHMVLDTIAAPMWWLAPFSKFRLELVRVPAAYGHWLWSFLLHWTFLLELPICAAAATLWLSRRRAKGASGAA